MPITLIRSDEVSPSRAAERGVRRGYKGQYKSVHTLTYVRTRVVDDYGFGGGDDEAIAT